jgi:hypothetical protein
MAWPVSRSSITKRTVDPWVRLRIWIFTSKVFVWCWCPSDLGVSVGESSFFSFCPLPARLTVSALYVLAYLFKWKTRYDQSPPLLIILAKRSLKTAISDHCCQFMHALHLFFIQIRLGTMTNQLKSYWKNGQSHLLSFTCVRHFRLRFVTWPIAVLTYDVVMDEDIGLFLSHDFRI